MLLRWRTGLLNWRLAHRPAVPDMGGPRLYEMAELVRSYLQARGMSRPILPIRPGKAARAFRAGANLAPDQALAA